MLPYYIICALGGYLIGSIPFGYILVKLTKGIDIRTVGSGNIGATNVGRILGLPLGILCFLLDAAKGITPVILASFVYFKLYAQTDFNFTISLWSTENLVDLMPISGLSAIFGHLFPVWFLFKGGKGVATGLGVFLTLMPIPTLIALGIWLIFLFIFKYISIASIAASISLPAAFSLLYNQLTLLFTSITVALLIILKHIPNIKRLTSGTEPKIKFKKPNE